jgi:hypothetical protein
MTSFLTIPHGQNATNSGKHCQAGREPESWPESGKPLGHRVKVLIRCLPHTLTPSGQGILIEIFWIR